MAVLIYPTFTSLTTSILEGQIRSGQVRGQIGHNKSSWPCQVKLEVRILKMLEWVRLKHVKGQNRLGQVKPKVRVGQVRSGQVKGQSRSGKVRLDYRQSKHNFMNFALFIKFYCIIINCSCIINNFCSIFLIAISLLLIIIELL